MCSARKETVQRNNNKKAPKSKQIRSFVSLTSCSLMDSATASLMKKEKKERRKSETTLSLYVCRAHRLPDPQPDEETATERERERDQVRTTQTGGGSWREKRSGAAIPRYPGNQRSFKEKWPMANTGNCVQTKSHMTAQTPLPIHRERGEENKKEGWRFWVEG